MTNRAAWRAAGIAASLVVATVALVAVAAAIDDDVRVLDLSRDPATLSRAPVHDGLLTTLGGFAWSAAIAVALVAAWVSTDRARVRLLFGLVGVSAMLMIDDMFLVHERLAPRAGVDEELLFACYGMVMAVVAVVNGREIRRTAWPLLVVALGFFALGVARNRLATIPLTLLPDTWPFLGVGFWATYVLHVSVEALDRRTEPHAA